METFSNSSLGRKAEERQLIKRNNREAGMSLSIQGELRLGKETDENPRVWLVPKLQVLATVHISLPTISQAQVTEGNLILERL